MPLSEGLLHIPALIVRPIPQERIGTRPKGSGRQSVLSLPGRTVGHECNRKRSFGEGVGRLSLQRRLR